MNENNYSEDPIPTRQKWRPPAFDDSFPVTGPNMERFHREGVWAALEPKQKLPPTPCQGCTNYYGKTDGGNKLVCAIHPSGANGDTCPDFEQKENT